MRNSHRFREDQARSSWKGDFDKAGINLPPLERETFSDSGHFVFYSHLRLVLAAQEREKKGLISLLLCSLSLSSVITRITLRLCCCCWSWCAFLLSLECQEINQCLVCPFSVGSFINRFFISLSFQGRAGHENRTDGGQNSGKQITSLTCFASLCNFANEIQNLAESQLI